MSTKIKIDPKRVGDVEYLCEPVTFPVVVEGEERVQYMTSSRFCCVKHSLENGVYRVVNPTDQPFPRLIMITTGDGEQVKSEGEDGEVKLGKSVPALLTGTPYRYHYKDGNLMNNLLTNFETRDRPGKKKWY
jgi:hypothetical protein